MNGMKVPETDAASAGGFSKSVVLKLLLPFLLNYNSEKR